MNLEAPPFNHGIRTPRSQPVIPERALASICQSIDNLSRLWVKRPLGSENTMANYRESLAPANKILFDQLHEWTLGGTHNYGDNFSAIGELSNQLLRANFNPLYESTIGAIRHYLCTPHVYYREDCFLPFFRLFDFQHFTQPYLQDMIQSLEAPPHFDNVWSSLDWPYGTSFDRTLSFTLAIELPAKGHGLRIMNVYRDPLSGSLHRMRATPSNDQINLYGFSNKTPNESYVFSYKAGDIVFHSGHEFHSIAPFTTLTPGDRRITLQGWAVWVPGTGWLIFG